MENEQLLDDSHTGRWTNEEHETFLNGLREHGRDWKQIAIMIPSRTVVQIRTHAQKYFQKLAKEEGIEAAEAMFRGGYGNSSYTRDKILGIHTAEKDEEGNIILTKRTSTRIAQKKQQKDIDPMEISSGDTELHSDSSGRSSTTITIDQHQNNENHDNTITGTIPSTVQPMLHQRKLSDVSFTKQSKYRTTGGNIGRPPKIHRKYSLSSHHTTLSSTSSSTSSSVFSTERSSTVRPMYRPPEQYTMLDNDGYDEYGFYHGIPGTSVSSRVSPNEISSSSTAAVPLDESSTFDTGVNVVPRKRQYYTIDHPTDPSLPMKHTRYTPVSSSSSYGADNHNVNYSVESVGHRKYSTSSNNNNYYTTTVPRKGSADQEGSGFDTSSGSYFLTNTATPTEYDTTNESLIYTSSPTAGEADYRFRKHKYMTAVHSIPSKTQQPMDVNVPAVYTTLHGNEPRAFNHSNTGALIKNIVLPSTLSSVVLPNPVTTTGVTTTGTVPPTVLPVPSHPLPPPVQVPNPSTLFWENLLSATPRGLQAALLLANHILCSPTATFLTPHGTPSVRLHAGTKQNSTTVMTIPTVVGDDKDQQQFPLMEQQQQQQQSQGTVTPPSFVSTTTTPTNNNSCNTTGQYISLMIPVDVLRSMGSYGGSLSQTVLPPLVDCHPTVTSLSSSLSSTAVVPNPSSYSSTSSSSSTPTTYSSSGTTLVSSSVATSSNGTTPCHGSTTGQTINLTPFLHCNSNNNNSNPSTPNTNSFIGFAASTACN